MCLALMDGAVAFIVVVIVGAVAVKTNMTITKIIIIIQQWSQIYSIAQRGIIFLLLDLWVSTVG
jgi:hypothetical protein